MVDMDRSCDTEGMLRMVDVKVMNGKWKWEIGNGKERKVDGCLDVG